MNNSSGDFRGWGNVIGEFFNPKKIEVINKARGGFLDLNEIAAAKYEKSGHSKVDAEYFTKIDHTHTSLSGARVNAESVIGLRKIRQLKIDRFLAKR